MDDRLTRMSRALYVETCDIIFEHTPDRKTIKWEDLPDHQIAVYKRLAMAVDAAA